MRHKLTNTLRDLVRAFSHPFDHYRPELHYMRGPGPKCQAKGGEMVSHPLPAIAQRVPTTPAQAHT